MCWHTVHTGQIWGFLWHYGRCGTGKSRPTYMNTRETLKILRFYDEKVSEKN